MLCKTISTRYSDFIAAISSGPVLTFNLIQKEMQVSEKFVIVTWCQNDEVTLE